MITKFKISMFFNGLLISGGPEKVSQFSPVPFSFYFTPFLLSE